MSKQGCIVSGVIIAIIAIILLACCGIFLLLSAVISEYDVSTSTQSVQTETITNGGSDKIAMIRVEGMILDAEDSGGLFATTAIASAPRINEYLDAAKEDEDVKAIILSIDSPGGDAYASDLIYQHVKAVQESGKPVVTLMRGTAASGGYYIAAPSNVIVAHQGTLTGSIGVRLDAQSLEGLYEKLGIENRTITNTQGNYKDLQKGLFDEDPDGVEDQIMQEIVDESYERFLQIVMEGRDFSREDALKLADGRIYTGQQAFENGLIDQLGEYDEALAAAEDAAGISNATVIEYKETDFWSTLMGYITSISNPTAQLMQFVDATPGVKVRYLYSVD